MWVSNYTYMYSSTFCNQTYTVYLYLYAVPCLCVIYVQFNREFKKLLQRRRRQCRLKNEFIFHLRISVYSQVIYFVYHCQITKLNLGHRSKFEIEFYKISRRSSRSSDNAEMVISHCCFAEDGKEMYKKL